MAYRGTAMSDSDQAYQDKMFGILLLTELRSGFRVLSDTCDKLANACSNGLEYLGAHPDLQPGRRREGKGKGSKKGKGYGSASHRERSRSR